MIILLNGEKNTISETTSVADLVATQDLSNTRYAVEINQEIISRSQHSQHILQAGDKVEIVQAIGGG